MMFLYLLSAFAITAISLLGLNPVAVKVGLVDIPGGRKTHLSATPLVGGLGIFLGITCISIAMPGVSTEFAPLLSLSALILLIGTVDDAKELTPLIRTLGHSLVALTMAVIVGVEVRSLGPIITDNTTNLDILTVPITVFATVGVINAINMTDGVDGLTGGLAIVTLSFISAFAFYSGQVITGSFCLIIISSLTAFLSLNFRQPWRKRALVYLGDAGSTTLGFMLAWLLITSTQGINPNFAPVYALWFLAVPLFDAVNLLIKRPLQGRSPFAPGNDHLHHMLLSRGFSAKQVVLMLVSTAIALGGIGCIGSLLGASQSLMFQLFVVLFSFYFCLSGRIKKIPTH